MRHCSNAVPKESKSSHECTYVSRIVTNTDKDNIGSKNWALDWAKLNNKSYAWVAKPKTGQSTVVDSNRNVKNSRTRVSNHRHDSSVKCPVNTVNRNSETQGLYHPPKTIHVNKCLLKVSKPHAIHIRNRFDVLNSIDNNTDCALQCTGNVKCVQLPNISSTCKQSSVNVSHENVLLSDNDVSSDNLLTEKQLTTGRY